MHSSSLLSNTIGPTIFLFQSKMFRVNFVISNKSKATVKERLPLTIVPKQFTVGIRGSFKTQSLKPSDLSVNFFVIWYVLDFYAETYPHFRPTLKT